MFWATCCAWPGSRLRSVLQNVAPLDLCPARVTALSLIAMHPGINQSALVKELNVAGLSVLQVVDTREASGWVRRVDVEGDRHRDFLEITELVGHDYLELLSEKLASMRSGCREAGFIAAERRSLMTMLDRLAARADSLRPTKPPCAWKFDFPRQRHLDRTSQMKKALGRQGLGSFLAERASVS